MAYTDDQLSAIVDKQIADARMYYNSDRDGFRDKALQYFEGQMPDLPPMGQNRSSVVSRDISDLHGMVMPGLLRVFFSSDDVVRYEPTRPGTEEFAKQATDYVNYVVMRESSGYRHFRDGISDGVLLGNGIIKHWWDQTPEYDTESFTGLSEAAYKFLLQDPNYEDTIELKTYQDPDWTPPPPMPMPGPMPGLSPMAMMLGGVQGSTAPAGPTAPPQMGIGALPIQPQQSPQAGPPQPPPAQPQQEGPSDGLDNEQHAESEMPREPGAVGPDTGNQPHPQAPLLYDCKIKRKVSNGRLRLSAIPYEEFLIERSARILDEENCRFACHVRQRTRSSLVAEGFKKQIVDDLPSFTTSSTQLDREIRDDRTIFSEAGPDRSTDLIEVHECYLQLDDDDDGIAEWMRVVVGGAPGGRSILLKEPWGDGLPFSDLVPDPRPYAWRGFGLFDLLADIQRVKTVCMRAVLDNIYQILNPQKIALGSAIENHDELINPTFGGVIWAKQLQAVQPVETQYIVDKVSPVIDYMDMVAEKRTGISRQSQTLDLDALQNQSATAVNAAQSVAFSKVEEYARNISENGGLKRAFKCILKLIVKHQDRAKTIRLRGTWVDVDPRAWDANMDASINTGLGAGSRDRDLSILSNIASKQELAIGQGGPNNPLAPLDKYANTLRKMVETAGLKSADPFFNEITPDMMQKIASQPPPPNPQMVAAQAQAQIQAQKVQGEQQLEKVRMEGDSQREQARAQADAQRDQAQLDRQSMMSQQQLHSKMIQGQQETRAKMIQGQQKLQADVQLQREKQVGQMQVERERLAMEERAREREAAIQHQEMLMRSRQPQRPMQGGR